MGISRLLVLMAIVLPAGARAQEAGQAPSVPAGPATNESPAVSGPPPPAAGGQQPPGASPSPNGQGPAPGGPARFVLELNSEGLLGPLQGGLFFGRGNRQFTAGVAVYVSSIRLAEFSSWGGAIGPGVRWVVLGAAAGRLDLLLEAHALLGKVYASDYERWAIPDGYSYAVSVGPGLRFWLTDALSIAYVGLISAFWHFDRATDLLEIRASEPQRSQLGRNARSATAGFLDILGAIQVAGYF